MKSRFMKSKKTFAPVFLSLIFALAFSGCRKTSSAKSEYPKSIVALSPAAVEILFAIGAGSQVSAVTDLTDYPPEAVNLPKVGGFDGKTLSLESILSYKPDLVYLTDGMHNFLIQELEKNEIAYYISSASSINAVEKEIIDIGKITGHEAQAKTVVAEMKQKTGSFRDSDAPAVATVYYEVWNSPYMTAGTTSFINDVITSAGAENIFDDLTDAYPIVSEETIIKRQPDVILITASSGVTADSVAKRSGWAEIPAVKNGCVFVVDDNLFSRPGPRVADAVLQLEELLEK